MHVASEDLAYKIVNDYIVYKAHWELPKQLAMSEEPDVPWLDPGGWITSGP